MLLGCLCACMTGRRGGGGDDDDDDEEAARVADEDGGLSRGGEGAGTCAPECEIAADCCQPGMLDCPGAYPNDWSCDGGFCAFGGCGGDADCTYGGALADWECHPVLGVRSCVLPCTADPDCAAFGLSCAEEGTDDGVRFCVSAAADCDVSGCGGFGRCDADSGFCVCDSSDDCQAPGYGCRQ